MPRSPAVPGARAVATALLALSGCATYEPAPLDPNEILAVVEARRHVGSPSARIDLARAVELARERSPDLLPLREAAETARVLGDMETPLPNPSLSVGPTLLSGPDVTSSTRWGVEAAGGWLLDVTGSRAVATDLRSAAADAARIELVAHERETYLALRRAFTHLAHATETRETLQEIAAAAASSERVARQLVEAAQATALDVTELRVEALRAESDVIAAQEAEQAARDVIASLTGVAADVFSAVEGAANAPAVPERSALVRALLDGHPQLDRLRAEHALSELRLRAEIAAQIPGIELGPGYDYEEKTDKYALGLGIELPLFDRNEIGIAAAEGERREVRARFEAAVAQRLAAIDAGLARLRRRTERLVLLRDDAEPAARRGLELAEAALRGGALDGIRFLSIARSERAVRLERLAAAQAVLDAWCDLEEACGAPLLVFASTALPGSDAPGAAEPAMGEGEER